MFSLKTFGPLFTYAYRWLMITQLQKTLTVHVLGVQHYRLSSDQLRPASLIGRNAVTWTSALSTDRRFTTIYHVTFHVTCALVWHFRRRVVIFPCPTYYSALSVKCPLSKVHCLSNTNQNKKDMTNAAVTVNESYQSVSARQLKWSRFSKLPQTAN